MAGQNNFKAKVQKMGGFLSGMVMPNIGAFIAWGILTALFIPTGYFPNEQLNELVSPTLTYILPVLIAYTGGYNIYGRRGGVAGVIATIGVIVGSDVTMLVGGMVMGPFGAWLIKKIDKLFEGKIKPGLEMLVDNFSLGIAGAVVMAAGYMVVTPVFNFIQGILTPLATQQALETGKSILYLVEANCGNWAGLILAFAVFGKGMAKKSAPGASIIMIIGGIGEVVFPYALMKPITLLGPILGNMAALAILSVFSGGAVAAVSPGSLIALIAMSPKGGLFINVASYVIAGAISFAVVSFFLIRDKSEESDEIGAALSADISQASAVPVSSESPEAGITSAVKRKIEKVVFACDAGMGSSAMGASILKVQLNKIGLFSEVAHVSVHQIPDNTDVVVTNSNLVAAAKQSAPAGTPILPLNNFMDEKEIKRIAQEIKDMAE
ncbi:MAG: PTS mannitol transporter subunit IICB [Dorea sp.]|nr:PTS mannitol transporter subunit IICB [Dorea sp.]